MISTIRVVVVSHVVIFNHINYISITHWLDFNIKHINYIITMYWLLDILYNRGIAHRHVEIRYSDKQGTG